MKRRPTPAGVRPDQTFNGFTSPPRQTPLRTKPQADRWLSPALLHTRQAERSYRPIRRVRGVDGPTRASGVARGKRRRRRSGMEPVRVRNRPRNRIENRRLRFHGTRRMAFAAESRARPPYRSARPVHARAPGRPEPCSMAAAPSERALRRARIKQLEHERARPPRHHRDHTSSRFQRTNGRNEPLKSLQTA